MTKEDIKKELQSQLDKPDNEEDKIFNKGFSLGFIEAATWRINSVWHDITEIPENNRSLLCVTDHGCNVFGPNNTEFKEVVEYFHIKKWAYLEDLIPNMED